MTDYTHIVVGGGSAGCVVAARLSEDAGNRVLLLEAGPWDVNPLFHIPIGAGKLLRRTFYTWGYSTEPDTHTRNRSIGWARARVMGGGSSINGLVHMRGAPEDYDNWERLGAAGWSYREVEPYFRKAERHIDRTDDFYGKEGPLAVSRSKSTNPLFRAFLQAAKEDGRTVVDDINSARGERFGRPEFNIDNGRRASESVAYLRPALRRGNIHVIPRATATRVLFEGKRVVGIEYVRHGRTKEVRCTREVVLSGGVINSPKLLMLSGIGDAEALRAHGIPIVHHLPGVGRNLMDHAFIRVMFTCPLPITLYSFLRFDRAARAMIQAQLFRTGPGTVFPVEGCGFTCSTPAEAIPDLQWQCMNTMGTSSIRVPHLWPLRRTLVDQEGFNVGVFLLQPDSRGAVTLRSSSPMDKPLINPGYLHAERDVTRLAHGIGQIRRLTSQQSMRPYITAEISPGAEVRTYGDLLQWVPSNSETGGHQVGTCRIGTDDDAVVDPTLRVRGLEGLRVVDASVMPMVTRGNTNAPTVMIAEKAADMIRGRAPLVPRADTAHVGRMAS